MKTCCGAPRETAFCPVCGQSMTGNKFMGMSEAALLHEQAFVENDVHHAEARVREIERKYKADLEPAKACLEVTRAKLNQWHQALKHARANQVGAV